MSAGRQAMADAPALIYTAQGVSTLISRAWNLLRANLRDSLILMLVPTLVLMLFSVLISIPAGQTFLTPTALHRLALNITLALLGLGAGLVYFFLWGFSCCALIRLYYSAIVGEKPMPLKDAWRFVVRIWPRLLILLIALAAVLTALVVADFVILFAGGMMSVAAFGALGSFAVLGKSPLLALMLVFFLLLWGFLVVTVLISLMTMQGFLFVFPFVAVSTASDSARLPWGRQVLYAYKLLFASVPRLILFSVALFFFSFVVSIVLNAPVFIWAWLEVTRLGVTQQHYLPLHIQVVVNLWQNLVHLLLMPFYVAAVTLFWYDCRVRKEGLDLRLRFENLLRRRGLDPVEAGLASSF